MIQLRSSGFEVSDDEVEGLKSQFQRKHTVKVENFLEPKLRETLCAMIASANFVDFSHKSRSGKVIAREERIEYESPLSLMILHLLNQANLFDFVQSVSDCRRIGSFSGRVFRRFASEEHFDNWHGDVTPDDNRLIGLSLDLGLKPALGGEFHLRDRKSGQILGEVLDRSPGSVHLFRISRELEHRVAPVRGEVPRVACAGWFSAKPDYRSAFVPKRSA